MSDFDPRGLSRHEAVSHPLVRALLEEMWDGPRSGDRAPRLTIDPRDEMLVATRELAHGNREAALVAYLQAGLTAARTYGQLLGPLASRRARPLRVLDFAAGWGRVSRFLAAHLAADLAARFPEVEITVCDISSEAVEFQRDELGLPGFVSASKPEDLVAPTGAQFDAVLVTSLFTHLPESTFVPWLRRLLELVAPDGVLALSTHPEERLPEVFTMPASGLFYEPASEIPHLDVADYGRTWVTPAFVERAIAEAGETAGFLRFRRCLWHLQDLWVIARSEATDLARLQLDASLDGGPDGRLEGIAFEGDGRETGGSEIGGSKLWLGGWAAHPLHPDPQVTVEVVLAGDTVATTRPDRPRPDVAERLDRPDLAASGWLTHVPLSPGRPEASDVLRVRATDGRGLRHLLHVSTVEGLLAWQETRRLREELTACRRELKAADGHLKVNAVELRDLHARVSAMEASRFWKLRNLWFRIKGS